MNDKTANIIESYRLSPGQKHLWQQQRQSENGTPYRVQSAVSIEGEISVERLKDAFKNVIRRHEILRTVFQTPGGMTIPVQSVCEAFEPLITEHDLESLNHDEQQKAIEAIFQESKKHPFDFENGQLLSVALVRLSNLNHVLILALPAICGDTKSLVNLTKEIADSYRFNSAESDETDEPFQYADFAEWHNELFAGEIENEGQNFWREQKINTDFKLYCENSELKKADFETQVLTSDIKPETAARIKTLSADNGVSASDFLLTCWQVLLYRLSGQTDVTVGMSSDGRKFQEMDEAIGLFAEYVALPGELKDEIRFDELLKQVGEGADNAENWQEFFDWKRLESSSENEKQTPFLSFCFDFSKLPSEFRTDEIVFKVSRQYSCLDRFKLKLSCFETEESLTTQFYFDAAHYQNQSIERLAESFHQLLESAIASPNAEIATLEIFSDTERRRLLEEFNQTRFDYRSNVTAHQLFEEIAAKTPDKTAVVCEDRQLTYGELNAQANQLARRLRTLGAGPEILCAICVERSVEMVVGILAVLKTGGCYVPLDPDYPKERLAFILEDARPKLLLTDKKLLDILPPNEAKVVLLETKTSAVSERETENMNGVTASENLAYLIYTSGSTGKPKGVMITHGNLGHYAQSLPASLGLEKSDRYLHTASISFSSSVRQLMLPLSIGATVVVAASERIKNPLALFELVREQAVTILDLVPSYWRNCLYALDNAADEKKRSLANSDVRLILSASEPLPGDVPRELAAKFKPGVEQINMLGQTETTGIISVYPINPAATKTGIVPVGRPIGNTQIYMLDSRLRPAAFGAPGEIYIGGANIGRGYLNYPELSAEKFIPNPFVNDDQARLYKTGDLGRYDSDGQIEFLGRIDNQVKIR
ncbi:MAG: amino acid adenylation domain-containing protein, partial [Acidobacteriota bacterium]|nr:amino acid adenylation domain-containing protein [Acidobacteriota bacterium]